MSRSRLLLLILPVITLASTTSTVLRRPLLLREISTIQRGRKHSTIAARSESGSAATELIEKHKHVGMPEGLTAGDRDQNPDMLASGKTIKPISSVSQIPHSDVFNPVPEISFPETSATAADMTGSAKLTMTVDPTAGHLPGKKSRPLPQAIQLAENVRLPAALIPPQGTANQDSPVAQAAEEIVSNYYRDLHAEVVGIYDSQDSPETDGDTVTIPQIPETEQIRLRSDEQFRALYGDEKYNQQAIGSAIEVMLPPASGTH